MRSTFTHRGGFIPTPGIPAPATPWQRGQRCRSLRHGRWRARRVVSDFSGLNELLSQEILNLSARTILQYRIRLKTEVSSTSWHGMRAVLYADAQPPALDLRKQLLAFFQSGSLWITGPASLTEFHGPYAVVTNAVLLSSHRCHLLRFWKGGAVSS